jgi:hypothetical protein
MVPVKQFPLFIFFITGTFLPGSLHQNKIPALQKKPSSFELSFDYLATTPLLHPPYISGVINDPTDPAATIGIVVSIMEKKDPVGPNNYTLSASSDNQSVVHDNNIIINKATGSATIKIIPSDVGYSNITLTLKGREEQTLVINYAASLDSYHQAIHYWHTGISDASAVVSLDSDYMVIGDDEINALFVYNRYHSGLPVAAFSYADLLNLPEGDKETDCEAGTRSLKYPERTYWSGSMSNGGKSFKIEPNRDCLFQTNISGTGGATKFSYKGCYKDLRRQLIKWGDAHEYNLSAAANGGQSPKKVDGFNVEGIVFAPDSTTLYIGFRAPLVPLANRVNALIAPIQNFETWFNDGHPTGDPVIGAPIELNLGGRGIRDFIHLNNGGYIIIAGSSDEALNGALYTWSGRAADAPVATNNKVVTLLKAESGLEIDSSGSFTGKVQVISDNGSTIFYNDGISAKFLNPDFKKFRSDIINIGD